MEFYCCLMGAHHDSSASPHRLLGICYTPVQPALCFIGWLACVVLHPCFSAVVRTEGNPGGGRGRGGGVGGWTVDAWLSSLL